jgi:dTDP-4-dehydrorhamnose reductase
VEPPDQEKRVQLWAGVECSVVRVGDTYVDQIARTGHAARPEDLDRLVSLGVTGLRYPVLWERTMPEEHGAPDWSFADRLVRLREAGLRAIVGLVHHGSGPRHTSLVDESFVSGLARFAQSVARRYPWVTDYTPVNEPLTTARFSALYGHWYPHARSDAAFVRALLIECEAIRAAMRAIREVTPGARLVQTEDMGTVFSTPHLEYQARFESARRFLSLDLLAGRVDAQHPLRGWLLGNGADERALDSFVTDPCPPDLIGLNHYVTSDRFLDEHVAKYPPHARGGNGIDTYADVEAVRVLGAGIPGHRAVLEEVAARYALPVALTEVHIGCAPEEQVRWLYEAWKGAKAARDAGVDVRAVTAWSVFGAYDWDSLLVEPRGHYEPGLFDIRGATVRPTALARVARDLATVGESDHPMLSEPGWWRRGQRLIYPSFGRTLRTPSARASAPILVTGGAGTLGRALARAAAARGISVVPVPRSELDVTDRVKIGALLDAHAPWAVINAAGYVRVDDAELDRDRCFDVNVRGPAMLADACAARGIRLAVISSDLVFDGLKGAPYLEHDEVAPLSVYGASKAAMETLVAERCPDALVVRTSAFFGPWDEANFLSTALGALRAGRRFRAAGDVVVSPTYVPDLAHAVLTLLIDGSQGIFHVANGGAITWFEWARWAARLAGIRTDRLIECPAAEIYAHARRPARSALASHRCALLAPLEDALARYVDESSATRVAAAAG